MRFLTRSFVFLLALGILALGAPAAALADTYENFALTGNLADGGSISGTFVIDNTTGYLQSADLTVSDGGTTYLFDGIPQFQIPTGGSPATAIYSYFYYYYDGVATDQSLDLVFPEPLLLNYQGGPLCSIDAPCAGVVGSYFGEPAEDFFTSLTAAPTPEPPALAMMLLGMAVLGLCWGSKLWRCAHAI